MQMSYSWEEYFDEFFDEMLDSKFKLSTTEEVEYKLEDTFGYNKGNISKLVSEVVTRSEFAEVDGSSILF